METAFVVKGIAAVVSAVSTAVKALEKYKQDLSSTEQFLRCASMMPVTSSREKIPLTFVRSCVVDAAVSGVKHGQG